MILIKNAHVYAPQELGKKDVLIGGASILHIADAISPAPYMEVVDGKGSLLLPGLIDRHVHVTGGGGEDGFSSRVPEIQLSALIKAGITTVVGLLGTDSTTRSVKNLLAKVKGLTQEGISAYAMSGAYRFPSPSICASVGEDIVFIEEILGAKLALSDHRSSHITKEDLKRLASEVRVAGMLSGKKACLTLHMGDEKAALQDVFAILKESDLPPLLFHPTHVTRNERLFQSALRLLPLGGTIDITANAKGSKAWIMRIPKEYRRQITMSSDGQGSFSTYDENGNVRSLGVASVSVLLTDILSLIRSNTCSIEEAFSFAGRNCAQLLGMDNKGEIREGADGDLLLFDQNLHLKSVMAKGVWMMKDNVLLKKGRFETEL